MNSLSSGLVTEVGVKILLKSIQLFGLLSQCPVNLEIFCSYHFEDDYIIQQPNYCTSSWSSIDLPREFLIYLLTVALIPVDWINKLIEQWYVI